MNRAIDEAFGDRLPAEMRETFHDAAEQYRFDEVLGEYKPYRDVIGNATKRAARRLGLDYRDADGLAIYNAVPTWGPHPEVPATLRRLAEKYQLVILSNAAEEQIGRNVAALEAPFAAVFTAEQAQAYKPRFAAFEYMLNKLGCGGDEIVHVSSSPIYDLRPARELGIVHTVLADRGYEPPQPWLGYVRIAEFSDLPSVLEAGN